MTLEQANKFSDSGWWRDKSAEQITALMLYESRLCLPDFSIVQEAVEKALGRPVFTHEFAAVERLRDEFEKKHPDAETLKAEMSVLKTSFCYDLYNEQVTRLSTGDVHISPDFQCDQTGGFPTSLCVNWEEGKAWLQLNENLIMDRDEMELNYYRQLCADFGVRDCQDEERFNALLRGLGEDALQSAELPVEEEDEAMRW